MAGKKNKLEKVNSKNFEDNLIYQEPTQNNNGILEEPLQLFQPQNNVLEEQLNMGHAGNYSIEEETLFDNDSYYIQEENISFKEPIRPEFVSEEVLFKDEEEISLTTAVDDNPTLVSDALTSLGDMQDLSLTMDLSASGEYVEKNFAQKILESQQEILDRYDELKNFILLYKGVKSRVSNDFDSFNMGRTQLFKLGFSTKSLKLYLNLEFDKVEPRLKCKDVSHKKAYKEVPVFLRIKSERAMKNAKYLIEQVATRFELKENPRAVYVDSIKILKEKAKTYN